VNINKFKKVNPNQQARNANPNSKFEYEEDWEDDEQELERKPKVRKFKESRAT